MTASFLAKARGVIHVGASNGQERFTYAEHGLPVVWIEALPEAYHQLVKNIQEFAHQSAVQALLTDVVGKTYPFKISNNNGESSSILDLAEHRDIWPTVDYVGQIDLVSTTLDQLVNDHIFNPAHFDALVLDTQGSELLVLKGAESILKHINFLKVEAANFNAYMGCTTVAELTKWLQSKGYRLTQHHAFANHPAGGQYFDLYFERACAPPK
jgi:FkbM family methyltransferase